MPEQSWELSAIFFALGHLGLGLRILFSFIGTGQRRLTLIDEYVADNGAIFLLGLLSYWAIVCIWLWTDAIGIFGGVGEAISFVPGQLNAWTIPIALVADWLLKLGLDKWGDKIGIAKLSDKIAAVVPKVGKAEDGTPPPTA